MKKQYFYPITLFLLLQKQVLSSSRKMTAPVKGLNNKPIYFSFPVLGGVGETHPGTRGVLRLTYRILHYTTCPPVPDGYPHAYQ